MKYILISVFSLIEAGAVSWGLYKLAMWPRPGDFIYRGIMAPGIVEEPITLSTDIRGLV